MNEYIRTHEHENQAIKLNEIRSQMLIVKDTSVFRIKCRKFCVI
jgi:hypothetical protein